MTLEKGSLSVKGSLALVSQQTWIFNGTVRDNILMGSEFDSDWYKEVIEACALTSDFKVRISPCYLTHVKTIHFQVAQ